MRGRRRGHGEGSIRERQDGRWEVRINLGRGIDGKRRRKSAFAQTQGEAVKRLKKLAGREADGQLLTTSTPTVARYLEEWYATNSDTWRPSTRRGYRYAIDGFLVPAFGPLRLEQLTPATVQRWLTEHKNEHGARRRITLAHATLRSALADAQRLHLVSINAATLVKVPKPLRKAIAPLDLDQSRAFLRAVETHPLGALFSVALSCGLRLGEATGLSWEDVNLETGEVQIRQQLQLVGKCLVIQEPKTAKSRRTLMLPAVCLTALRAHRTQQKERRLKAGARWVETNLVFTTYRTCKEGKGQHMQVGAGLHPRNVLRTLHLLLERAKLPRFRFHDLRHSAASLLIAGGVELAEVSMLLGHSELRVTMDFYAHLQKQTAAKAATLMDALLAAPQAVS
jgi:integrase